jgi:hypothetical protein
MRQKGDNDVNAQITNVMYYLVAGVNRASHIYPKRRNERRRLME